MKSLRLLLLGLLSLPIFGYSNASVDMCNDSTCDLSVEVNVERVSFSGAKYIRLTSDSGTTAYDAPHYIDANHDGDAIDVMDRNVPVAFVAGSTPRFSAVFRFGANLDGQTVKVKATGSEGVVISESEVSVSGDTGIMAVTSSSHAFPASIRYYDHLQTGREFALTWHMQIGKGRWSRVGTTRHSVFITLGTPSTRARQQSLFAIGCRNADGQTDPSTAVDAIWADFTDRQVYRRGTNTPMWYFGPKTIVEEGTVVPMCATYQYLLAEGDGSCGAWAQLFGEILQALGIASGNTAPILYGLTPQDIVEWQGWHLAGNGLLVNGWRFPSVGVAAPGPRLPAQGPNGDSPAEFADHSVVRIGGKIYDPAYGISTNSLVDYENAAFAGFEYVRPDGHFVRLRNNPVAQEVTWIVDPWPQ